MSDTTPTPGTGDVLADLEAEVAATLEQERPPRGGPDYQSLAAAVMLALGVAGLVLSWGYGLGTLTAPGPGLWPFAVAVLISGLAATLHVVGRGLDDAERFTRSSLLPVFGVATFIGLAALIPVLGFEIPSLLLCLIWLKFLGGERWRTSLLVSVAVVVAFWLLFVLALGVPLPRLV